MINNQNFILKEIPQYHPLSTKYAEFWKDELRKCLEGCWVSGKWMPGNLYFYINYGTILLNEDQSVKGKVKGKPLLRDLEWEFFYNWMEARGFSGFSGDVIYTCHRMCEPSVYASLSDFEKSLLKTSAPNAFDDFDRPKLFIPARQYLRKIHTGELGYPLFQNQSEDFMMMGSRGFGKSYSVGVGIVLHEWVFNGETQYITNDEKQLLNKQKVASIAVTAGETKYSGALLEKVKFGLDNLPGAQQINGVYYPSPFNRQYSGTWRSGDNIKAAYKKKIGGNWVDVGSNSVIYHRSFKDNPFACNGLRCSVMVFEEIGMFDNLIASRNASVECVKEGSSKYGTMMFLGTGGDMGKGTIDASKMFRDPESFNLVKFDDEWEHSGKIAYFVPAYLGINQFKDKNGITNIEEARKYLDKEREKLKRGKSGSEALDDELQNRPITPSEMFLMKGANWFPVAELQERLNNIRGYEHVLGKNVTLYFDEKSQSGVNYKIDLDKSLVPLNNFPLTDHQKRNKEGCVTIFEFPITQPDGKVPKGMYIIGHDPYAKDDSEVESDSLATIYVLKTKKYPYHGQDEIVATFVGRPYLGRKIYNEILYKLSLFYGNAKIYFENMVGNTKEYFEKNKRLDLLALQPTTVFSTKAGWDNTGKTNVYGYPMSNPKMKMEGINYIRDWLLEERGLSEDGRIVRNLDFIPDPGLLQEMILFNMDGNFDRVMGFMGCIIGLEETYNQYIKPESTSKGLNMGFLTNNKYLFKPRNAVINEYSSS